MRNSFSTMAKVTIWQHYDSVSLTSKTKRFPILKKFWTEWIILFFRKNSPARSLVKQTPATPRLRCGGPRALRSLSPAEEMAPGAWQKRRERSRVTIPPFKCERPTPAAGLRRFAGRTYPFRLRGRSRQGEAVGDSESASRGIFVAQECAQANLDCPAGREMKPEVSFKKSCQN